MPFPWKKVKSTKISQFVNDHLQKTQKRRGDSSLMVETGFPTSLVDLFIKNREKLKKPSKKKRGKPPPALKDDDSSDLLVSESPCRCPFPSPSPTTFPSPLRSASPLRTPRPRTDETVAASQNEPAARRGEDRGNERCADVNGVLVAVVKMFLVVILALGTKKFAVGITLSAFLLFFLEYVGKYVCRFRPCSDAQKGFRSMFRWVSRYIGFMEDEFDRKINGCLKITTRKEDSSKPYSSDLTNSGSDISVRNAQTVKSNGFPVAQVEEIQCEPEEIDEPSFKAKLGYDNEKVDESCSEGKSGELMDSMKDLLDKEDDLNYDVNRGKSKRARLKSKMKRFVTKKLRTSRKRDHSIGNSHIGEDKVTLCEEEEEAADEHEDGIGGLGNDSKSTLSTRKTYTRKDTVNSVCTSGDFMVASEEAARIGREGQRTEYGKNSRYLVLCLIVLIGLIGGRIVALSLTLLWCLILKSSQRLRSHIKVPTLSSSAETCS